MNAELAEFAEIAAAPAANHTLLLILLLHACSTLMMTGLIWFVQIVHYPLMARVGVDGFASYEAAHTRRTTLVVAPLMLVELSTAIALAFGPFSISGAIPLIGIVCLIAIWISTASIQVPMHRVLEKGFDPSAHKRLVRSNWVRTLLWSVRGVLAMMLLTGTFGA